MEGKLTVDVVGTEISKFGFLEVPFASVEVPFVAAGEDDLSP
jgi:hypothetical protein